MRAKEEGRRWVEDRAELTDSSQSHAASGSRAAMRSVDRATLSSLYQELRGGTDCGPDWVKGDAQRRGKKSILDKMRAGHWCSTLSQYSSSVHRQKVKALDIQFTLKNEKYRVTFIYLLTVKAIMY